jgi:hypothetical protein
MNENSRRGRLHEEALMACSRVNSRRPWWRSGIAAVLAMIGMAAALPAGRAQDYPARIGVRVFSSMLAMALTVGLSPV